MGRLRRERQSVNTSRNGETRRQAAREGKLLKQAVDSPGAVEVPEATIRADVQRVDEILPANLDPDAGESGTPLEQDPALITVPIDRPNPHSWNRLYPDLVLRTVLLGYRPQKNARLEYYFVTPGLQGPLKKELKQVRVHLVADVSGAGELFLWIVPETEFSPYYNAIMRVLAKGEQYVHTNLFRFPSAELSEKVCRVRVKPAGPDDPVPVLPSRPISRLLPEALKQERLITTTSHPVYMSLTAGGKVS
jgi:hypothetical protein